MQSPASKTWSRYSATLAGAALLAVSYAAMALRVADVGPLSGLWNLLIIPAYLTVLFGVVLAAYLPIPTTVFVAVGASLWLVPFAGVDFLRRRQRRASNAAAMNDLAT